MSESHNKAMRILQATAMVIARAKALSDVLDESVVQGKVIVPHADLRQALKELKEVK